MVLFATISSLVVRLHQHNKFD